MAECSPNIPNSLHPPDFVLPLLSELTVLSLINLCCLLLSSPSLPAFCHHHFQFTDASPFRILPHRRYFCIPSFGCARMCLHVCVHVYACGGQRSASLLFLKHCPLLFVTGSPIDPKLVEYARLDRLQTTAIDLAKSPYCWDCRHVLPHRD